MEEKKRGGRREGAGRKPNPDNNRKIPLMVRISQEAHDKLKKVNNKSEWIDTLIKDNI